MGTLHAVRFDEPAHDDAKEVEFGGGDGGGGEAEIDLEDALTNAIEGVGNSVVTMADQFGYDDAHASVIVNIEGVAVRVTVAVEVA